MEKRRRRVKKVNRFIICHSEKEQYSVWTPYGRCWEKGLTLDKAVEYCKKRTDFVGRKRG